MKRLMFVALAVAAVSGMRAAPAAAGMGTAYELEHARANARAGGPISEYDAELLERWGNSTGGPDWRKQYRKQQGYDDAPVRVHRHKSKPRVDQN
jgi:hypothetical protein